MITDVKINLNLNYTHPQVKILIYTKQKNRETKKRYFRSLYCIQAL